MRKTRLLSWVLVGVMVAGEAATPLASVAAQVNTVTDVGVLEAYTVTEEETTEENAEEAEAASEETENLETADVAEETSGTSETAETATAAAQTTVVDTDDDSTSALRGSGSTMDDDTYTTSDGYEYTFDSNGAVITGYTGSVTNLTIPSKVDGYTVRTIGESAFEGNTDLVSVVIPDTVLTIESTAFKSCTNLKSVTLSSKLESLYNYAFESCTSLTEITIPKGLTDVGYWTWNDSCPFLDCSSLTKVTFESGTTTIAAGICLGCSSITEIVLPDTVIEIGEYAFRGCTNLEEITIPSKCTTIGYGAFESCKSLTEVTIPDSVLRIEDSAFSGCTDLATVTLSSKLEYLGNYAFGSCTSLTEVEIPKNLTEAGYWNYDSSCPFYNCSSLSKVTFASGTTTIVNGICLGCSSIEEVVLPSTVTEIGEYAFKGCMSLEEITIPSKCTTIGYGAFINCKSLTEVTIPDSVLRIEDSVFSGCTSVETVTLSSKLEYLGDYAFESCTSLTEIEIPKTLTEAGYWNYDSSCPFYKCSSLSKVTFEEGTTTIVEGMLIGLSALEEIVIPDTVTEIGAYAFRNCTALTTVWMSKNIETVYGSAFDGCRFLETVYYAKNETAWNAITVESGNDYLLNANIIFGNESTPISECTATLSTTTYTYDGSAKTPTVTVKAADSTTLKKGTDYTVSYTNNTNPGTATVKVTGIGDYEGTITLTFTIKLASCSVKYINNTMYGLKVAWDEVPGASGYYIYIRNDDGTYSTDYTDYVTGGSTTDWTDERELTGGKDYTYKVAAYYKNSDGTIIIGPTGTTKTCKYLKWGEVESVTNTTSGLKVTWTKVAGANGYYIFRKAAGESDYTQIATVTGSSKVSWTDTSSLTSGKNYTYKVSAIFTNSKGQITKGGALTTKTTKYLTAGKISSLSNTANGVYIKWSKVTGATGYYVYRKSSSASSYTLVKTITSVGTVSYTDTAVKSSNNVTYTYYVQPYFKNSSGAITKAGYTTKAVVRLVAPTISSLTNSSSKTLTVKWGTKSGVAGYEIQYSTSSSFASGNKTVTVTGSSSSSKAVSSLTKGKTYYVRIRTYKTVNGTKYYSAWSTAKSVKISK